MALAAVRDRQAPPATLAERLAEAEHAEAAPRKQLMTLEPAYRAAVAASDHAEAAQLKPNCEAARQELAIAEGHTAVLRELLASAAREQAEASRAAAEAADMDDAQSVLGDCLMADRRAIAGIEESLSQVRSSLEAAQVAFREAQEWEDRAGQARQQAAATRAHIAGETSFPKVSKPNRASVLLDHDPAFCALMQWRR